MPGGYCYYEGHGTNKKWFCQVLKHFQILVPFIWTPHSLSGSLLLAFLRDLSSVEECGSPDKDCSGTQSQGS